MDEERRSLITFLVEQGAVRFGDFVLKSGERSPFFVNLGEIRTGPALATMGRHLARALGEHFPQATVLFGPAYKGIALAAATAMAAWSTDGRELAVFYNRKEGKAHGERGDFIGYRPKAGDQVVIIDDVVSSGGTKLEAVEAMDQAFSIRPAGILVAVDRRRRGVGLDLEGIPVRSIAALTDLIAYLEERGDPTAKVLRRFQEGE